MSLNVPMGPQGDSVATDKKIRDVQRTLTMVSRLKLDVSVLELVSKIDLFRV
jgi:hypothetical protein